MPVLRRDALVAAARRSRVVAEAGAVGGVTSAIAAVVFRLWELPLRVPLYYARDAISAGALVQRIIEGSYDFSARVGFPFGLDHRDFPLGADNLNLLLIKVLTLGSKDWALVLNAFYLLTFPLAAVASYVVMRRLRLAPIVAGAMSALYAFAPYHFLRGEGHLFLAAYYPVPFACLLLLRLFDEVPPLFVERAGKVSLGLPRHGLAPLLAAAMLGATGSYYAIFFAVLAGLVSLIVFLAHRRVRTLVSAAALIGITATSLLVNLAPALLHRRHAGANPQAIARTVAESDYYALRLIQMIVPIPGHRVAAMNEITAKALTAPNNSEAMQFLGLVASLGFVYLLIQFLRRAVRGEPSGPAGVTPAGVIVVLACLVGTTGGFSWVLGLAGFTEVRAWNRLSIYIAFLSLVTVGRLLGGALLHLNRAWRAPATIIASVVLLALGVLDQSSRAIVADSRVYEAEYRQDRAFVVDVEQRLGHGAAVLQWPFLPYPEAELDRRGAMVDYDPFRGFLHSKSLKWSYGGMRGREDGWERPLEALAVPDAIPRMVALGFDGLYLDRQGYDDHGAAVEAPLASTLGPPVATSPSGRYVVYDLRPTAARLRRELGVSGLQDLRRQALAPAPRPSS